MTILEKILNINKIYSLISRKKTIDVCLNENIRNEQVERINDILDVAYNHSEFYKKTYQEAGISFPVKIENLLDLKSLPVIKKEES